MIAIVSIYIDESLLEKHLIPSIPSTIVERHFIDGTRQLNIAALYNRLLGATHSRFVIFSHPDVEFNPEVLDQIVNSLESGAGAVGLVGMAGQDKQVVSHNILEPQEVWSLDSCLIAVDRTKGIYFDETTFDELHLYGEDYCFAARAAGFKCLVVPAKHFFHESATIKKYGASWGNHAKYYKRLVDKWHWRFGNGVIAT